MKRLVNVSVNPFGRFGAPETELEPCGAVSVDDELMRVSLLSWDSETALSGSVVGCGGLSLEGQSAWQRSQSQRSAESGADQRCSLEDLQFAQRPERRANLVRKE